MIEGLINVNGLAERVSQPWVEDCTWCSKALIFQIVALEPFRSWSLCLLFQSVNIRLSLSFPPPRPFFFFFFFISALGCARLKWNLRERECELCSGLLKELIPTAFIATYLWSAPSLSPFLTKPRLLFSRSKSHPPYWKFFIYFFPLHLSIYFTPGKSISFKLLVPETDVWWVI